SHCRAGIGMRLDGLEAADRIACRGSADRLYGTHMTKTSHLCTIAIVVLCMARTALAADRPAWPATLPVYDHIVIVIEENKNFEERRVGKECRLRMWT